MMSHSPAAPGGRPGHAYDNTRVDGEARAIMGDVIGDVHFTTTRVYWQPPLASV